MILNESLPLAQVTKVWVGQEKTHKNALISTVSIAVLPSLSDTISLSSSPVYSESSIHPSSELSSLCSLSKSMKTIYPMLQKLIFLWLAIIFLPIWPSKQHNRKWQSSLPSSEGSSFWNRFQFGCAFEDNKSRIRGTRASFRRQQEHNHEEQGAHSMVRNLLRKQWCLERRVISHTLLEEMTRSVNELSRGRQNEVGCMSVGYLVPAGTLLASLIHHFLT